MSEVPLYAAGGGAALALLLLLAVSLPLAFAEGTTPHHEDCISHKVLIKGL